MKKGNYEGRNLCREETMREGNYEQSYFEERKFGRKEIMRKGNHEERKC